ncbi:MAG: DUF748 domain-containing protein [Gammaproteobacteria bacterium]|nr:DUF748 domain-containing protein [Gammaproteobacteria bacterium]NDE56241.1 DUF748 domain-containing protein [Gammaproteobacteria bacterium]NDG86487.1 DUF748 domain-containing protein [Gammaproteobacteria bacterium]
MPPFTSFFTFQKNHRNRLNRLMVVVMLYGVLGGIVLPWWVKERLQSGVDLVPGYAVTVARLTVNPFSMAATLENLTLRKANGGPILEVAEGVLDVHLMRSLERVRPVLELSLRDPVLFLSMDQDGRVLWPDLFKTQGDHSTGPSPHWSSVRLEGGRIELSSATTLSPPERIGPIHLEIRDLDAREIGRGSLHLDLQTAHHGQLDLQGFVGLNPLGGDLKISLKDLDLGFYQGLLSENIPHWILKGRVTGDLALQFDDLDNPAVDLKSDSVQLDGFEGEIEGAPYRMDHLMIEGMDLDSTAHSLRLQHLQGEGLQKGPFEIDGIDLQEATADLETKTYRWESLKGSNAVTPFVRLHGLDAGPFEFQQQEQAFSLDRLTLLSLKSKDLEGENLTIDGVHGAKGMTPIQIDRCTAVAIKAPDITLDQPRLEDLHYQPQGEVVSIKSFHAADGLLFGHHLEQPVIEALEWQGSDQAFKAEHVFVQSVKGQKIEALASDFKAVAYDVPKAIAMLGHGEINHLNSPWGHLSSGVIDRLLLHVKGPEVRFGQLALKGALIQKLSLNEALLKEAEYVVEDQVLRFEEMDLVDFKGEIKTHEQVLSKVQEPGFGWTSEPRPLKMGHVHLQEGAIDFLWHRLLLTRLSVDQSIFDIRKVKSGGIQLIGFENPSMMPAESISSSKPSTPWRYTIDDIDVRGVDLYLQDLSLDPPARQRFMGTELVAEHVSSSKDQTFNFAIKSHLGDSGKLEVQGRAEINPPRANFRFGVDKLRLRAIEPYWRPFTTLEVVNGRLNLWGDVILREQRGLQVDYSGGADLIGIELEDQQHNPIASWESMKFDGLSISQQPFRFVTRVLTLKNPHASIQMNEQRDLNINHLLSSREPAVSALSPTEGTHSPKASKDPLPTASIGLLRIENAGVDFSDLSIKPGFHVEIKDLNGTSTGISSRADAMASLLMEGHINLLTPVKVYGELDPVDHAEYTDLNLAFKGLNLTSFSNYSGRFAGYRIEKGKLDMAVRYRLDHGVLDIENQALIDNLTLGEKVDPEASTWLVDLALSLLQNNDGKIDMNLPINGDLTNPNFSLWDLYQDAFTHLLGKMVRSPLSLIPGGSEPSSMTLETIAFTPGDDGLDETARTKLKAVAARLKATPDTHLDIRPVMAPGRDHHGLAQRALEAQLKVEQRMDFRRQGIKLGDQPMPPISEEEADRLFTIYFRKKYPTPSDFHGLDLEEASVLSPEILKQARETVLSQWLIGEVELQRLALQRAEHIRENLVKEGGVPDSHLYLRDLATITSDSPPIAADLILNRE